jgi:hypothetical protein
MIQTPGTVIGCAQQVRWSTSKQDSLLTFSQYQFCLKSDNCTALSYLPHNLTLAEFPNASSLQLAVFNLLISSSMLFDIQAANTMLADKLIRIGGFIPSLPDDQWVKEIVGWESTTWAALQIAVEKYATGAKSIDPSADDYVKAPETDGEKALCAMQRMRKSGGFVYAILHLERIDALTVAQKYQRLRSVFRLRLLGLHSCARPCPFALPDLSV